MSLRPCHSWAAVSRARTPGAGSVLAQCPLPLPVVGVFTLCCRPHPGAPTAFASRLEQTTNSGRVYALNQRSSQSPGFTVWPVGLGGGGGPWAQPGCDCAEPGGRLHGCPRKGSAGGPGPQGLAAHSLPAPVSRPHPASRPGLGPETASCSGSLWVLQAVSGTLGTALIKSL